jgi:hypothetical protein
MSPKEDSDWQESGQWVFRGDLHEVDDNLLRMWDQHGQREIFFLSWLESDLKRSLHPHLKTQAPEYWEISTEDWEFIQDAWALSPEPSIEVTLRQPNGIKQLKYEIKLMIEVSEGEFVRAPWEASEVKRLRDEIRTWVKKRLPDSGYGGDAQSFSPQAVMK